MKEHDCKTCIKRLTCAEAKEGMFCAEYQSKVPDQGRKEPTMWEGGEEN